MRNVYYQGWEYLHLAQSDGESIVDYYFEEAIALIRRINAQNQF